MAGAEDGTAWADVTLESLMQAIAAGDAAAVNGHLGASPGLAREAQGVGATRALERPYFLDAIKHHVYAGDTALHVAAASHRPEMVRQLLALGADVRARNRRGAEPLHYATDGGPGDERWDPASQQRTVEMLIAAGADPNARDRNRVTPMHRAVRTRCAAAVRALLAGGGDPRQPNGSGSTPLHLAVQNTGRGGTGTPEARAQQRDLILLLQQHGARASDRDGNGRTVRECASSPWIGDLLS